MRFRLFGRFRHRPATQPLAREGSPAERHALALRYGYNGMSFFTLYRGWEYFHPPEGEGFIAFERHNGVALACGDPVCAPADQEAVLEAFRAFCSGEKLTPAFVGATPRFAETCRASGWKMLKIGEEPLFDLKSYAPHGYSAKKMRSDARRAARDGMVVEVIPSGERPPLGVAREIEEVQAAWQATRNVNPLSFTLRLAPLSFAADKLIAIARCNGRIEGFASAIPVVGRKGLYLEAMIRRPDARGGTSESLFLAVTDTCQARGVELLATGLSPLRNVADQPHGHRLVGRALQFTFRHLNFFYKFRPLEHFKAKFGPTEWEDSFLIYRPGRLLRVSLALLFAFTPGRFGPFTAALSRFRKRTAGGQRRLSPGHAAGMEATLALAAGYSALAVQNPVLFDPFRILLAVSTFPVREAGEQARSHLVVDSVLLLAAGGWYARSAGRD